MSRESILIVDDEQGVQSSLQGILEDAGFDARGVSTGEECLTLLSSNEFAVVVRKAEHVNG